jgi:hypothetical protein
VIRSDGRGIAGDWLPLLVLLTIVFCCAAAGIAAAWF